MCKKEVMYVLGEAKLKRNIFSKTDKSALYLDNDEILFTVAVGSNTYFAVGSIPFGDMKVSEYLRYMRAFSSSNEVKKQEKSDYRRIIKAMSLGISLNKKMKTLGAIEYRAVKLLSHLRTGLREIRLNFDGLEYTKKNKARLLRFVNGLKKYLEVYVLVSDYRFVSSQSSVICYGEMGENHVKCRTYSCRRIRKNKLETLVNTAQICTPFKVKKLTFEGW